MAAVEPGKQTKAAAVSLDFQRLLSLEQCVVGCVETAAEVAQELANLGGADKQRAAHLCTQFVENIKAGQALIQEAIARSSGERAFEANPYQAMTKAHVVAEKVEVVGLHLANARAVIQAAGLWREPPVEERACDANAQAGKPATTGSVAAAAGTDMLRTLA